VANQLKCCESLDILLLWEVVAAMAGVAPVFEVGDAQLEALGGSEALVAATVSEMTSEDRSRGTVRLLNALRQGPPDRQLLVPLLILLAQQRRLITMQAQTSHLKLVAETYDRCQEVTMQYIQFLRRALSVQEYASAMPSIRDLASEYQIDPEIIFEIHRPLIKGVTPPNVKLAKEDEEGEINTAGSGGGGDQEDGEVPTDDNSRGGAGDSNAVAAPAVADETNKNEEWEGLVDQCSLLAPDGGFKGLTQTLFVTFWSLSLYDLHVPVAHYESTLTQVRTAARTARDDLEVARRDAQRGWGSQMRGPSLLPTSPLDVEALTIEANRMDSLAARLPIDLQEQLSNAAVVDARLKATRADW
jgi:THO complex subunit 2